MPAETTIEDIAVATIRAPLVPTVQVGDRLLAHREYAVVRVTSAHGAQGWSYGLTRGGAIAATVRDLLAALYVGTRLEDRETTFWSALRSSPASLGSGIGLRALSLLDLATWDAAGNSSGRSIAELLGGRNTRLPATAIVGYPPDTTGPDECAEEVARLRALGFARFKVPIASTRDVSAARVQAIRVSAPGAWVGLDAAWTFRDAKDASRFLQSVDDVGLGWFEDVFLPGDVDSLRQLRSMTSVKIAMGDDQGESYYPSALIDARVVDVVRFDVTCMGGITRGKRVIQQAVDAGLEFSPHIFGQVHSQVIAGLGYTGVACEWAQPGSGADPYTDSLTPPIIALDGYAEALPDVPGFGSLINKEWSADQDIVDPQGILRA